jgi:hypothetical protein
LSFSFHSESSVLFGLESEVTGEDLERGDGIQSKRPIAKGQRGEGGDVIIQDSELHLVCLLIEHHQVEGLVPVEQSAIREEERAQGRDGHEPKRGECVLGHRGFVFGAMERELDVRVAGGEVSWSQAIGRDDSEFKEADRDASGDRLHILVQDNGEVVLVRVEHERGELRADHAVYQS